MAARKTSTHSPVEVRAKNPAEWRRWLARHHTTSGAALLIYAKKDSGKASINWQESVEEALCFGWVDGVRGAVDAEHFSVRFTPRKPGSIWSQRNVDTVQRLIAEQRMQPAGVLAFERGKQRGAHDKAYSIRDSVEVPAELEQALAKNARGRRAFEAISPGQRKGWTRWVAWAKTESTRAARARDALLLVAAGRKAGETDNQAARRGVPSKATILGKR